MGLEEETHTLGSVSPGSGLSLGAEDTQLLLALCSAISLVGQVFSASGRCVPRPGEKSGLLRRKALGGLLGPHISARSSNDHLNIPM